MHPNGIGFFYLCIVTKDISSMKWKKKGDDSVDYINGYPIDEVWGTYHYLAREIAPRLKAFKAHKKHGWPDNFENQEDWNKAIHNGNVEGIMNQLDLAERQIEQNGNAKIIFFDLCLQMIVLIKKPRT